MKKNYFYAFWRMVAKPIFYACCRMKYIGKENVPAEGGYILASNHRKAIDPVLLGIGIKRQIMFMAKDELFKNKLFGAFCRKLGAFPVNRGKADTGSVKHFEKVLAEGNIIGIFIEGTRSKTGEFLPPKNGVSLIAFDAKSPVIPVCHTKIGFRTVVHYGKPLSMEDMGFEKGGAREFRNASRIIMDNIKALREEDLAAAEAKKNG